jgi:hypothetical protein
MSNMYIQYVQKLQINFRNGIHIIVLPILSSVCMYNLINHIVYWVYCMNEQN